MSRWVRGLTSSPTISSKRRPAVEVLLHHRWHMLLVSIEKLPWPYAVAITSSFSICLYSSTSLTLIWSWNVGAAIPSVASAKKPTYGAVAGSGVGVAVRDSTNKASVGSIIGNGNGNGNSHSHSQGHGAADKQVFHVDTSPLTCVACLCLKDHHSS